MPERFYPNWRSRLAAVQSLDHGTLKLADVGASGQRFSGMKAWTLGRG
ncbi:MAG: hypothetical protein LAQ69_04985 [Acidobacteriia bacterium]|nr:hypothetical protein [Terriglobia bacterium]